MGKGRHVVIHDVIHDDNVMGNDQSAIDMGVPHFNAPAGGDPLQISG